MMDQHIDNDALSLSPHASTTSVIKEFINERISKGLQGHLLVTGITGSGKTFLLRRLLPQLDIPFVMVRSGALFSSDSGVTERTLFNLLMQGNHKIVTLDGVELLAGRSIGIGVEPTQSVHHRVASIFKYCLDHTDKLVVGITVRAEGLHTDFLRSGRFSEIVLVSISSVNQRYTILKESFPDGVLNEHELRQVAEAANGFTAADIEGIYQRTYMASKHRPTLEDFIRVVKSTSPSVTVGLPLLKTGNVVERYCTPMVGVEEQRAVIMSTIDSVLEKSILPCRNPPRGILIHGPTGSGKTRLALECAQATRLTSIYVQSTTIRSKYVGQSEKNLIQYFRRARECAPCIFFLDQLDAIFVRRGSEEGESHGTSDRLAACLLTELDGLYSSKEGDGVIILATTDRLSSIDPAVIRPGRVGIHVGMPPSFDAQMRLLFLKSTRVPLTLTDEEIQRIIELTDGFTAAEMDQLLQETALKVIRRDGEAAVNIISADIFALLAREKETSSDFIIQ